MTKIQLLATLLALFIFAMLGAFNNEDYQTSAPVSILG